MRKLMLASVALAALALGPGLASADVLITPEVDTWVMGQPDTDSVTVDGDIVVGTPLPGTARVIEVPNQPDYNYVVVNKKRVLVEKKTRKVIKVY